MQLSLNNQLIQTKFRLFQKRKTAAGHLPMKSNFALTMALIRGLHGSQLHKRLFGFKLKNKLPQVPDLDGEVSIEVKNGVVAYEVESVLGSRASLKQRAVPQRPMLFKSLSRAPVRNRERIGPLDRRPSKSLYGHVIVQVVQREATHIRSAFLSQFGTPLPHSCLRRDNRGVTH
jgi:hypothetical protein